jgi:multidrug efflux pump subunit AcrB
LQVRLTTVIGADLDETDRLTQKAEGVLARHKEITRVLTTVNVGSASLSLTLVEPRERKATQTELMATIRRELGQIPGLRASVQDLSQQGFAGGRGKPVELTVRGGDWTTLVGLSQQVQRQLDESGLAVDLDSDYDLGPPELAIAPDRPRAADVSVNVNDIATTVNALIGGTVIGQTRPPAGAWISGCACCRASAPAPRTSSSCACGRPPATSSRCRAW